jgi:hypothetical protein
MRGREVPWSGVRQVIPTELGADADAGCSAPPAPAVTRAPARDLVGETRHAFAKFLASLTYGDPHVPVLSVGDAPFKDGVTVTIQARLSPAAVDRLLSLVDAPDR